MSCEKAFYDIVANSLHYVDNKRVYDKWYSPPLKSPYSVVSEYVCTCRGDLDMFYTMQGCKFVSPFTASMMVKHT